MCERVTIFAKTNHRNRFQSFGIKQADRAYHMAVVGKTGTGKSTLLEILMTDDAAHHEGFALIDPHGDLAERLAARLPSLTTRLPLYFHPSQPEHRLRFNVFDAPGVPPHLVVSRILNVFRKLWGTEAWGPRMEHVLQHALWALTTRPGATLLDVPKLLTDARFRNEVVAGLQDPVMKDFWANEFGRYSPSFRESTIAPILNKVGPFLVHPHLREVLGHSKSDFDLRAIMDDGRIFIANLSKGQLGEEGSQLLGALLVTQFELTALGRANVPASSRRPFYLYIDELASVATDSFGTLLSESRKYALRLVAVLQYVEVLDKPLRDALFENVGTLIAFRVGPGSARLIAREFAPVFTDENLMNLPGHDIYLRLMIDRKPSKPFSATTMSPEERVVA